MRLKSFYAKTMSDAMREVRETLGEDAIIVATREEPGGKAISVTAAVDNDSYARHKETTGRIRDFLEQVENNDINDDTEEPHALSTSPYPDKSAEDYTTSSDPLNDGDWDLSETAGQNTEGNAIAEAEAVVEALADIMIRHGASSEVTDEILNCASVLGLEDTRVSLVAALAHLYGFKPLSRDATRRPVMMVGPPGAGKTTAVAKLATRGVMDGLNIAVISTDVVRAGGLEQIQAFTRILNIGLGRAGGADELRRKIADANSSADQIIIDTGGGNPFDPSDMKHLAEMINIGGIDPVLVLPAGTDAAESSDMARIFAAMGVKSILPTRLDIARRLGGLLSAAHQGHMSFVGASKTQQVAEGFVDLTPRKLADFLMPEQNKNPARNAKSNHVDSSSKSSSPHTKRTSTQ